jgi:hypothetical protein
VIVDEFADEVNLFIGICVFIVNILREALRASAPGFVYEANEVVLSDDREMTASRIVCTFGRFPVSAGVTASQ